MYAEVLYLARLLLLMGTQQGYAIIRDGAILFVKKNVPSYP